MTFIVYLALGFCLLATIEILAAAMISARANRRGNPFPKTAGGNVQ